jgi:putative DNA primase/helicase
VRAAEIAAALGSARREGRGWRCRCPIHDGVSLVITDGRDRRILVRCWGGGCDPRNILAELRRRGLITGRGDGGRLPPLIIRRDNHADATGRIAMARRLWATTQEARDSPVVRYLASRGITAAPLPPSLRGAPRCRHPSGIYLPAMVARVDNIDGELIGVHRTYLRPDGLGKAHIEPAKAMLGLVGGGSVRLASAGETLMIGEGIETTLATMQAMELPGWAALSTSGLVALMLPAIVRTVIILADHDTNGVGERAARLAANRWLGEGRRVRIAMPPQPGTDFNDVMLGRAYARITEARDVAA